MLSSFTHFTHPQIPASDNNQSFLYIHDFFFRVHR